MHVSPCIYTYMHMSTHPEALEALAPARCMRCPCSGSCESQREAKKKHNICPTPPTDHPIPTPTHHVLHILRPRAKEENRRGCLTWDVEGPARCLLSE